VLYDIDYEDGDHEAGKGALDVRSLAGLEIGQHVFANFGSLGDWYPGAIEVANAEGSYGATACATTMVTGAGCGARFDRAQSLTVQEGKYNRRPIYSHGPPESKGASDTQLSFQES
jgi:hypothetical protein